MFALAQTLTHVRYSDMSRFAPVASLDAHEKAALSVTAFRGFAYTSGDSSVKAWDMRGLDPANARGGGPVRSGRRVYLSRRAR